MALASDLAAAGLEVVSPIAPGIHRIRTSNGFEYRDERNDSVRKLTEGRRVSPNQEERFLDRVSKQDLLPTLLAYFEIADRTTIDNLKLVFEDRNKIMHGQRVAQAKSDHAWTAVSAVEFRGTTWTRAPRLTWSIYRNCAAAARVDARLPRSIPTHCPHMDR